MEICKNTSKNINLRQHSVETIKFFQNDGSKIEGKLKEIHGNI